MEPDLSALTFALEIFTWWPLKPDPPSHVETTLLSVRPSAFRHASVGKYDALDNLVPDETLRMSREELHSRQRINVSEFLNIDI